MDGHVRSTEAGRPLQSIDIVEAIAEHEGIPGTHLDEPLFDVVDPDALDELLSRGSKGAFPVTVEFEYAGYSVVVASDGSIDIA